MKKYILLVFSFISTLGFGQSKLPEIVPPSPEASQLAKFVEMPVSLFTGTPSINIPIYTVNAGSVQIPISLSYHAKGIQVSEIASRVGLGWTLNAGGAITRQIRDKADDDKLTGYLQFDYLENFDNPLVRQNLFLHRYHNYDSPLLEDMVPDVFQFNFLNFSGKFIFNQKTKKVIVQSKDDISITPHFGTYQKIEAFTIKDKFGNTYLFNVTDSSNPTGVDVFYNNSESYGMHHLEDAPKNFYSAWYLSQIKTHDGKEINFEYESETVSFYTISDEQENFLGKISRTYYRNVEHQQQIKNITYEKTNVRFESDTDSIGRLDLKDGKAIKEIYVTYNDQTIKKYTLEHEYKTSPISLDLLDLYLRYNEPEANQRLFLKSFSEISDLGEIKTEFIYSDVLLPNRHSSATDVWGYYNGKNIDFQHYINPDRKVDSNFTQAGLLTKIIHPTGGVTEYEYEPNKTIVPDFLIDQPFVKDVFMNSQKTFGLLRYEGSYVPLENNYQGTFEIGGTSNVVIKSFISYGIGCQIGNQTPMYEIKITGGNLTSPYYPTLGNTLFSTSLSPGNYTVTVTPLCANHHLPPFSPEESYLEEDFFVVFKWIEIDNTVPIYGPGNRIKSIIKKDNNIVKLRKEYDYVYDNQTCSGKLFAIPDYLYAIESVNNSYQVFGTKMGSITPISNFNNGDIGYEQVIEKIYSNETNKYFKSVYTFSVFKDLGEYYKPVIFCNHMPVGTVQGILKPNVEMHQPTDLGFMRGLPLTTKHYNYIENTNSFDLVNEVINEYNNLPSCDFDINCFLINPYQGTYYDDGRFEFVHIPKFGKYVTVSVFEVACSSSFETQYFISNFVSLKKTTEINYLNSNEEVISVKSYFYDSPSHFQLTKQTTTNSTTDELLETNYYYPPDSAVSGEPYAQDLIAKNMIGLPLETVIKRNSDVLSTQKTIYNDWGNDLLLPQIIQTSKGTNDLEDRIKYNAYDANGNPLEVQKENGMTISYIWGYHHTQPVAKIENIKYGDIPPNLITAIQDATDATTYDEGMVLSALNVLRGDLALTNAMVTTFTYKPLVGISTITDPKGYQTFYKYDSFNRLKEVIDNDGNILSENEYHYRTQN